MAAAKAPAGPPPDGQHQRRLCDHLGAELGSGRFADVVVVLATGDHGGPADAAMQEDAQQDGEVAAFGGSSGGPAGARRVHCHGVVLALSPVWRAQLADDEGFQPLPREGTRKVG
jgi:hypothetical protein